MSESEFEKKPPKKFFLSFDAETDGLYGDGWWAAAVVFNKETDELVDYFNCAVENPEFQDNFVTTEILPVFIEASTLLNDGNISKPMLVKDREELRNKLWEFYMRHREVCDFVVDVAMPVESYFMRQCVMGNFSDREWKGPYPAFDVASMLKQHKKFDYDIDRFKLCQHLFTLTNTDTKGLPVDPEKLKKHHPLHDCLASGWIYSYLERN